MAKHKKSRSFRNLLTFLDQLEAANLFYDLKHVRNSVMVVVFTVEGYMEIEFFENGEIEVELFRREKGVKLVRKKWLERFINDNTD